MSADPDLAVIAQLIGERARATMLLALLGGQALPAGELAARAGVSPAGGRGAGACRQQRTPPLLSPRQRRGRSVDRTSGRSFLPVFTRLRPALSTHRN